ncbi:unnamed protein product [Menidia menidia]|uniref:(Atlantic silverside) hypothetical protein n=1 Tax=Menidia menidia TaxID=238744 RepID=A0A8S4B7Y6_9TELE|nr:unnamed protein product [Menidia menidia]CAG5952582.1 unnamed protein product [Menidia menidia]
MDAPGFFWRRLEAFGGSWVLLEAPGDSWRPLDASQSLLTSSLPPSAPLWPAVCDSLYELLTGLSRSEVPYQLYTDQRLALLLLCLFLILPMSVSKEISIQKHISVLGTLAASYLTVAIMVRYHTAPAARSTPLHSGGAGSWAAVFSVVPTICFGFQCHEASIAIYSSMENQRLSHWALVSVLAMVICLLIYTLTGVYGFLTFGRELAPDVLMSYSSRDVLMLVARLLFGVSIITIYPITVLLGRSVIQEPLLSCWRRRGGAAAAEAAAFERRSRWLLTAAWLALTLLIAVFVPDISKVISVIGGISAFFIFIFPGLCLVFAMQTQPVSCRTRVALTAWGGLTLLCGAFIFGQSTTIAVLQLLGHI